MIRLSSDYLGSIIFVVKAFLLVKFHLAKHGRIDGIIGKMRLFSISAIAVLFLCNGLINDPLALSENLLTLAGIAGGLLGLYLTSRMPKNPEMEAKRHE